MPATFTFQPKNSAPSWSQQAKNATPSWANQSQSLITTTGQFDISLFDTGIFDSSSVIPSWTLQPKLG